MAEKILNTRIQLKHDALANWQEKNTLLKKGEIAIAVIEGIDPSKKLHQPVMFKVGPGNFNDLEWASALAADVYAWAKKPSLDANDLPEIPGLKLGISFEVVGEGNAITNVSYDIPSKKFTFTKGETFATKKELEDVVANGTVVAEGAKIDVAQNGNTYTVSHEAIAQAEAGKTVAARTYVTGVTTDGYGHITGYTTATEEDQDLSGYKTKQEAYSAAGAVTKTVTGVTQNANGEIDVTYNDIAIAAAQVTDFATEVTKVKVTDATHADNASQAEHAAQADSARHADAADEATMDAAGNVITETYATKDYVDDKFTDANLDQYTTEQEVKDIVDSVIANAADDETYNSLTKLVDYIDAHGGEAADMAEAIEALEAKVDTTGKVSEAIAVETKAREDGDKAINDVLATYGDIVTHDAAEFATAEQGTKADTAFGWGDHAQAGYATNDDLLSAKTEVSNLANSIAGGIQSGTLVAAKATADAQGNVIANTYATIATVNTLSNDLTQGNITVGKAIEADTLDGKHAADFVMSVGVAEGFKNTGTATAPVIDICQKGEEGAITWIFDCGGAE